MTGPVLVLPDEPAAVRLMNTVWADGSGVHDSLDSAADLRGLLVDAGLAHSSTDVRSSDLDRARQLRDALRRLTSTVVGDTRIAAASPLEDDDLAVAVVNSAASATSLIPVLVRRGRALRTRASGSDPGSAAALAQIALDAMELLTAEPTRLRACYAPRCVLYFDRDHPRREWCSAACGNRARAARHYRRHHHSRGGQDRPC